MEDGRYYYGITDQGGNCNNRLSDLISGMSGLEATALNIAENDALCLRLFVLKETLT